MTPVSDALTAAQRSALAALEKAYVAEAVDAEDLRAGLHSCGISDDMNKPLTKAEASQIISELTSEPRAYNAEKWTVPF